MRCWADLTDEEKQRKREASARYRERNREKTNHEAREAYAANRDAIRARKRATEADRRERDPEGYRSRQRQKYEAYGRQYSLAWARANPEKAAGNRRKWRSKNARRVRELHLLANFGLSCSEYDALLAKQDRRCAICGREERRIDRRTSKPRALAVDHCHRTGQIRGLLCFFCNVAIGFLDDSPELAEAAAAYLRRVRQ